MSGPGAAAGVAGETAAEHLRNALQILGSSEDLLEPEQRPEGCSCEVCTVARHVTEVRRRVAAALAALDRGRA